MVLTGGVRAYTLTVAGSGYTVAPTITVGTAWSSNQSYTLNQQFYNAGKLYTVTTAGSSGTTAPTHSSGAVACSGGSGPFATLTYAGVQATASAPLTGSAVQYVSVGTSSTVTTNVGMGSGYIATPTVTIGTSWSSNQAYVLNQQYFNAGKLYTVTTAGNSGTTAPTHASGAVACSGGTGPFATLTYAGVSATATAIANLFGVTGASTFYIGGTGGNGAFVSTSVTNTSGGGGGSAGTTSNGNNGSGTTGGASVTGGGAGATGNSSSNATTGTYGTAATTLGGGGAGATGLGSAGVVGGAGFRGQIVITYPIMTPTGSYTAFNTIAGTASASQSIAVSGSNMTAGITITPPAGFEISTNNTTFSATLTVGSSGTISIPNLYLRLSAATGVGTYGGSGNDLVLTSTNAATLNIAIPISNVTAAPVPTIVTSLSSLAQFANTIAGSTSTSSSFTVSGVNLTGDISLSAPANFQISSDNVSFSSGLTLPQTGGNVSTTTIWARYSPNGCGAYTGIISLTSTGATSQTVSVSGYISTFYYKGSGAVQTTSNWSALSNGTGTSAPIDFVTDGVFYNIWASGATTGTWTIAGTGSKVIVGDPSVAAVTLTIGSAGAVTITSPAVMDIAAASSGSNTLIVQSTTLPTFGTVNAASTVEFQANTTISSPPSGGFGNLTVSSGSPVYSATVMTIKGNLTVSGTGTFFTDNSAARTISVAGNLSLSGTGGISNTPASTQSTTYTFTGIGKTITNTATGNLFSKSNIVIGTGASYALASDFNFTTGGGNRTISGAGALNIGSYTLTLGTSALTATAVTGNTTGKIITTSTLLAPIPTGLNWPCIVQYAASGSQTIVGGAYRHLILSPTSSSNVDSLASGATVNIADTLEMSGSKALKTSLSGGSIVYSPGATLFANLSGSATMSVNPPEWGVANGPTNVTVVANTLLFSPLPFGIGNIGTIRSLSGTLNLSAGSFTINDSNRLVMGNGSNIIRNGGQLSSSGGTIIYGNTTTDRVNVLIKSTCTNSTEITATQNNPGAVGTLTIEPGVTYTFTGGRTITDLVNNGIVAVSTASSLTFTILGDITGSGTVSGNSNASITFGGLSSTLNLTSGFQVARNLAVTNPLGTLTLATPVSLSSNLALTAGTIAAGNNNVTVAGSITGTGSFTGSGKVILTGGVGSQKISGATISNLDVNNGFIDSLTGSPTITGTFTLTSGRIAIPANDTLHVASGNSIAGSPFSSSKYFITQADASDGKGLLEINNFTGSRLFPVGDTLYYLPATINAAASSTFAVGALNGATVDATPNGTPLTVNPKKDIVDAKWMVRRASGSGAATVTLGWPAALEGSNFSAFSAGQIGISNYDGLLNLWTVSFGSGDNSANTATRTITSFAADDSVLAVGKVGQRLTGPASVLPGEVVINQFNPGYAAGSNNAYIELVNTTGKTFDLSNLKVAYQDAAGNAGTARGVLFGTLQPYSFWLLSPNMLVNVGQTISLNRDGVINGGFGATGQISLIEKNDLSDVDRLGYGTLTGGSYYESTPTTAPTSFAGLKRNTDGLDGNNNSTDFSLVSSGNIYLRIGNSRLAKAGVALGSGTYRDISVTGNSSLAGAVNLTGKLTVKTGTTFTTNNNLTIKSTINSTGSVGQSGGTITGNVTVERYIPAYAHRAWRMLSIPTVGTQTINAAWQEGQAVLANGNPGYGTLLTSIGGGNGYDASSAGNSLLKLTPGAPGSWTGVASTSAAIATTSGYMVYIRGDRSAPLTPGLISQGATTLRTNGTLYQGSQVTISVPAGNNVLVGNVYASTIDFANIVKSGITSFKVWDPKLTGTSGLGAFQTFSSTNGYDPTPGGGSYGSIPNSKIQSGQAFIVSSAGGGSITLTEAAKADGVTNGVFKQSNILQQFKTSLYGLDAAESKLVDGATVVFNDQYTNEVDNDDAVKMNNTGENIGLQTNGTTLAIEARNKIASSDVIQYNLTNLRPQQYRLEFAPKNMDVGLSAYVEDNFLETRQAISLQGSSFVNFTITSNAASAAADRFRVVFKNTAVTPAVTTTVKAYQRQQNVQVDWMVANEQSIKNYEVEQSTDGESFSKAATKAPTGNGSAILNYTWLQEQPANGDHYYRIKAIAKSGEYKYTAVAKVTIVCIKSEITVYPNPVKNKAINLQLTNMDKGTYNVCLLNDAGQVMMNSQFVHNGANANQQIPLNPAVRNGNYRLEIMSSEGHRKTQSILISND